MWRAEELLRKARPYGWGWPPWGQGEQRPTDQQVKNFLTALWSCQRVWGASEVRGSLFLEPHVVCTTWCREDSEIERETPFQLRYSKNPSCCD